LSLIINYHHFILFGAVLVPLQFVHLRAMASSAECAARSACAPAADFVLPNVSDPAQYVNARYHGYQGDSTGETALQFSKGTTTLGFKFQGGVIISVDSRSTQGSYIGACVCVCVLYQLLQWWPRRCTARPPSPQPPACAPACASRLQLCTLHCSPTGASLRPLSLAAAVGRA
jgi:hypothetical protein